MLVARHFLIGGRVQGVGFRFFTEDAAIREGLHGWVRNLPDGRVEMVVEGKASELDQFICRIGDVMQRNIREAKTSESPATGEFRNFVITR